MRVTLTHNPGAGDDDRSGAELCRFLRAAGHDVRYQSVSGEWLGVEVTTVRRPAVVALLVPTR
jgi:hypothetical protein